MKLIIIDNTTREVQREDGTSLGRFSNPLDWDGALSRYVFTEHDGSQWAWDVSTKTFQPLTSTDPS